LPARINGKPVFSVENKKCAWQADNDWSQQQPVFATIAGEEMQRWK
jgi:hypothetical protein